MQIQYPKVTSNLEGVFILEEDYFIKDITIPKGFTSDGLTLKIRLLRLIVDKYQPKFMPFFFLHDYLCNKDDYIRADKLGQEIIFEIEKSWRTKVMMVAIKLYHKIRYGVETI